MFARCIVFATLAALSTAALADRDPKKSPASDHIVLTQGAVSRLEKILADTADWAKDRGARERARTSIQMVEPGLARIRKADPAWDLKAWEKTVAAVKARLAAADAALEKDAAAVKAVDDLRREFLGTATKVREGLELLAALDTKPDSLSINTPNTVGERLGQIAAVKSLDELCKAKNLAAVPAESFKGQYLDPAVGCRLAASHRDLAAKYFELQVRGNVARKVQSIERAIERAKTGDVIDVAEYLDMLKPAPGIDALRSDLNAAGKGFGFAADAASFEPASAAAAGYPAALAEAAKTSRWSAQAKFPDVGITAALAGDFTGKPDSGPKGKVLRAASFTDWMIDKDYLNRPASRTRNVLVIVKIDGEAHCRIYERTLEEKFTNGAWGRPYGPGGYSFRVSSCK